MIIFGGAVLAFACFLIYLMRRDTLKQGELKRDNEILNGAVDGLNKVSKIHDRIKHDADYAKRVRDRFTRK